MNIRHILLSSGSLALLTGRNKYDELDEVQNRWAEFELANPTDTVHDWRISWERFTQANPDIVITKTAQQQESIMEHQPEFLGNFHRFKLNSHTCNVLGEQVTQWFVWDAEEIDKEVNLPARVVQKDTREEAIDTLKRLYPEAFVPLDY